MNENADLYNDVVERIDRTAALQPYRDIILYDWPEGDEHLTWVLSAQDVEILDWAQHVEMQAAMAEQRN